MSNGLEYAKRELEILKAKVPGALVIEFEKEILELVKKFMDSGQSNNSAPYYAKSITSTCQSLMMYEPLTPITGEPDEWESMLPEKWQNRRCTSLFKDSDSTRLIGHIVWKNIDVDHDCFSGGKVLLEQGSDSYVLSSIHITAFPFIPKVFYVDVKLIINPKTGEEEYVLVNKNQYQKVLDYYAKPYTEGKA